MKTARGSIAKIVPFPRAKKSQRKAIEAQARNPALKKDGVNMTSHVRKQMEKRNISQRQIMDVLRKGTAACRRYCIPEEQRNGVKNDSHTENTT